jgi:hypothetical protein
MPKMVSRIRYFLRKVIKLCSNEKLIQQEFQMLNEFEKNFVIAEEIEMFK